jgi:L-ascorbate metabolism protein UlaG (beta-lactamase superfamily)
MIILLSSVILFCIIVFFYLQHPKFGKLAGGERLERIKQSPNYKNNQFQNIHFTPKLTEGVGSWEVLQEFFFAKKIRQKPLGIIPSTKTDLRSLPPDESVLVWFGHSSYFIQLDGKKILVDPVFGNTASPLPNHMKAFKGTNPYTVADIPEIDYLFISHDHWDHFEYSTLLHLKPRVKKVICGMGTGEHLEYWGYDKHMIIEKDWDEKIILDKGFEVHTTTARHFSGRGIQQNKTLWMSFLLQTPSLKLFIGGDSGYDTHFAEIGITHGPFDLAILENGQYDKKWRYIHLMPDEVLRAAKDLNAKRLLPVHSSKYPLSNHAWDEPLITLTALNEEANIPLATPMIGEKVNLADSNQAFTQWWIGID